MAEPAPHDDAPQGVDESPVSALESAPEEPPAGRSKLLIGAVALLGIFVGYLAWQTSQLQTENRALETEVTSLQAELRAHQATLAGVRERTSGLRSQLDELEAWLGQSER